VLHQPFETLGIAESPNWQSGAHQLEQPQARLPWSGGGER
jgi:hypothetical protein